MVTGSRVPLWGIIAIILLCQVDAFKKLSTAQSDEDLTFDDVDAFVERAKRNVEPKAVRPKRQFSNFDSNFIDYDGSGDYGNFALSTFRISIYLTDRMHPEYQDPTSLRSESLRQRVKMELTKIFQQTSGYSDFHITSIGDSGDGRLRVNVDLFYTNGDEDEQDMLALLSQELRDSSTLNVDVGRLTVKEIKDQSSGRCPPGMELCPTGDCVPRCDGIAQCVGGGDEIGCEQTASSSLITYRSAFTFEDRIYNPQYADPNSYDYTYLERNVEDELYQAFSTDGLVKSIFKGVEAGPNNKVQVVVDLTYDSSSGTSRDRHLDMLRSALGQSTFFKDVNKEQILFRKVRDVARDVCGASEDMCSDGSCVPRCNNVPDCDDGSDELECPVDFSFVVPSETVVGTSTEICADDQFQCDGSRCIPSSSVCNRFIDCRDASDELNCVDIDYEDTTDLPEPITEVPGVITPSTTTESACGSQEFQCKSDGRCISYSYTCNSLEDCEDGSDESKETCGPTCNENEYQCGGMCMSLDKTCDGVRDCPNGEDEDPTFCAHSSTCNNDQFKCDDGTCIELFRRCDYARDCTNNEDELNCSCDLPRYLCNSGMCIDPEKRCNGVQDCDDGSDELIGCPDEPCEGSGMFTCDDGDTCLEETQLCDGTVDCLDQSDEEDCDEVTTIMPSVRPVVCSDESTFQCDVDRCLSIDLKCDGNVDCADGTDERNCQCTSSEWQCLDGSCIERSQRCDQAFHCADQSDEIGCPTGCNIDQWRCANGECIKLNLLCNGFLDCSDESDENKCEQHQCGEGLFKCNDGPCIPDYLRCDGHPYCRDQSDEIGCDGSTTTCEPDQFRCDDGTCLSSSRRCDKVRDCAGGEDERSCSCTSDEFRCSTGQCVDSRVVCDGLDDCYDGSDERNCTCTENQFRCTDGQCLEQRARCDGYEQCADGSDERDCQPQECTASQFRCGDGLCIEESWKCDGVPDCNDSSDEIGCTCYPDQFQCQSGQCILQAYVCDSKEDCSDGSDESGCPCTSDEYSCKGGGCVRKDQLCNGISECSDGSDEDPELCTRCASYQFECSSGECIFATERCNGKAECIDRSDEVGCPELGSCGSYEYQCDSGECISQSVVCDGRNDCLDGSDEKCEGSRGGSPCDNREFTCTDGTCISMFARCDQKYDCRDGSDEIGCTGACDDSQFQCTDRQCISRYAVCDGRNDCLDGSDEQNCPVSSTTCPSTQFACKDGSQCIEEYQKCDQRFDCADRSDEENCPGAVVPCYPTEFTCGSGDCVAESARCNNVYDCPDGSDESGCPRPDDRVEPQGECRPDQFACANGDCIRLSQRCNNNYDCADGTDEYGCTGTGVTTPAPTTTTTPASRICRLDEFTCNNGECTSLSARCNGYYECTDRSDEYNCATDPPPPRCSSNEFSCADGRQCIEGFRRCDRQVDCYDRSDEQNCPAVTCRPDEFTCRNGNCIAGYLRCNRAYDCSDGSDETDCTSSELCDPSREFSCRDGRQCIPLSDQCNGNYDCRDYSDEENCQETFQCDSGERILASQKCNGRAECPDGSDEFRCQSRPDRPTEPTAPQINLVTIPANQTIEQGRQVVFRCRDEGSTRAPVRWVRQGHNRLPPKSTDVRGRLTIDEVELSSSGIYFCEAQGVALNTPGRRSRVSLTVVPFVKPVGPAAVVCSVDETACRGGQCIPKTAVCDGKFDCQDKSDEDRCNTDKCEPNEFHCDNKRCIQKNWVCDSEDDCLDGSDERSCPPAETGSICEPTEFMCSDRRQCVPKAFVCDNELDCQDASDEFGCSEPIVVELPERTLNLEVGDSFTLNCRAVGKPIPEVVWRLNWNHVPASCTQTSVGGYGTLTCTNVQIYDQGAYSCEVLNSLGRIIAHPDTIVVVSGAAGAGVCVPPRYNVAAAVESDCISCFCFGVTTQCTSVDQNRVQLPPPSDSFGIVGVNQDLGQGNFQIRNNEYPISSSYVRTVSRTSTEIYINDRSRLGAPSDLLLYFSLPSSHRGNLLGSYGGYLNYEVTFKKSGLEILGPQVIIKGGNMTLMYLTDEPLTPNVPTPVSVRFVPGKWYKNVHSGSGVIEGRSKATREELMRVLQNVELLLIRASYSDGFNLQTTISSIQLDTISYASSPKGRASEVESCTCPQGYAGLSCEECAPNYRRMDDGRGNMGRCVLNITCGPTEFGDPANGIPCQLCPCPLTNPANQFSQSCYLDSDNQVTCNCQTGYSGRRCESCASGYSGNPGIPGESCRPVPPDCEWNEFICVDLTQCMHMSLRCDGKPDCLDGSDETYCNGTTAPGASVEPDPGNCITTFTCPDGTVHPWSRRCDGIADCTDREDEMNCQVCFNSAHRCSDRHCINYERICDGFYDCSDASDEFDYNCFDELPCNHMTQFTCSDQTCIDKSLHCDGTRDCQDGSDEWYCNCECDEPNSYKCLDGTCIKGDPSLLVCNGIIDCQDGSDEESCCDPSVSFRCLDGGCIDLIERCDSIDTCLDGSDELNCCDKNTEFRCGNGTCVDRNLYCNGLYDCQDGSDEPRSCPTMCNPDYEFKCGDGSCIGLALVCDRHNDCTDGSDESDAAGCCDPLNQFSCSNKTCIDIIQVCDRIDDCSDGSDEIACNNPTLGFIGRTDEAGQCNSLGSLYREPDPISGLCQCKELVVGSQCSQCQRSAFYLNENSEQGCIPCYCMGVSTNCTSSNWYRAQEVVGFVGDTQGFVLVDPVANSPIQSNLYVDSGRQELIYREFQNIAPGNYYWVLPQRFIKDKVTAYGGNLTYSLRYVPAPGSQISRNNAYDVEIYGNDITLRYYNRDQSVRPSTIETVSVPFYEQYWETKYGQPVSRENLMEVLVHLDYVLIKATYTTNSMEVGLKEVRLDYAVPRNTGGERAFAVESCECPPGHKGLSCESCDIGYKRDVVLGRCVPCDCNGYSDECNPETGFCVNCRNNRGGEYCEQCAPGFEEDYSGYCVRRDQCTCDERGSLSTQCDNGQCLCKSNVEGDECKTCRPGFYHLSSDNPDGCLRCWCSGVTDKCTSSYLNRLQIPMNLFDDHNFTITNRLRTTTVTDLQKDIAKNELTFNGFGQLPPRETYYWSLPQLFTGDKLNSYGGTLSLKQRFNSASPGVPYPDVDIILIGADQKEFVWMDKNNPTSSSQEKEVSVVLTENMFSYNQASARREDFLKALSSVEAILVRASFSDSITSTSLRDVVMDTAVDYATGQPRALEVEQCTCPVGHIGNSCENCAQGYYKDNNNRCQRCRCGGKEQSCTLLREGRLLCNCLPGYSGEQCEISGRPDTPVGVFEVRIPQAEYIVESGGTIELSCEVSPPVSYQMTYAWDRADGLLPLRRVIDNRLGTLVITQARPYDSGTYICRASTGVQVKEARTILRVTGGPPPSKPIVIIDEQREELYVRIGEYIRVRCRGQGSPPPQLQWYRRDGQPLSYSVTQVNGDLTFNNPAASDSGVYVCQGSNREGSAQAVITINVSPDSGPSPPIGDYIIVQVPESVEETPGGTVRITCRVPESFLDEISSYKWSRMRYPLPERAQQVQAELIIPDAQPRDSGMYTCTVTDSRGRTGKATTDVVIASYGNAPSVRIDPERQTIHQGTNAELRCTATGNPKPTITWSKDNEQLSRNVQIQGDVLKITNAEVNDRGLYRCSARNNVGESASVAVLEVERREPPSVEMYPAARVTLRKGESTRFQCHVVKGYPSPTVSWARSDGRPMTPNTEVLEGGVIKFMQVTGSEEGSYICTSTNDAGTVTAIATLEIESLPEVTILPSSRSMTVKEGQRLRIECSAVGDPYPTVSWEKLQVNYPTPIPSTSTTSRSSVYEIASVRREDEGVYQCSATNSAGTTVERIQVLVEQTLPAFPPPYPVETRPPGPQPPSNNQRRFQIPLGGQFEFRCSLDERKTDSELVYEFRRSDGRPLPRDHTLEPQTLIVSNIGRGDEGEYACIIKERSTYQSIITIYAEVEILEPPRITLEPARQVVRPGDNANLRCAVTGDQPISINWSKQSGELPPSVIINRGVLMFRGIQVTDAGKYLCEAVNPVGSAEAIAEVIVNERPLLTAQKPYMTLPAGRDGELRCSVYGVSPSAVQWSREGAQLPFNARATGAVLRLFQVTPDNSGRYKCEARTPSGDYTYDYIDVTVPNPQTVDIQIRASKDEVSLGDSVDLYCDVTGDPRAYVTWKRNRGDLPSNAVVDGNILRISQVDPSNGGVYVCSVTTSSGMFDKEYPLLIQSTFSATRSIDTRSIQFGSTVVLKCGAQVAPPVSFTWSKQNGQLPVRARIQDDSLEIPEVQADDAGTYVCTASNTRDSKDTPTLLIVTGVIPSFSGDSYLALPTLPDAYLFFDLEVSFKPESNDGVILYNSQRDGAGDFISFGLSDGFTEFRFDVGSGPAILRSRQQLSLGEWHTAKLTRNRKEGTMSIDGGTSVTGKSVGRFQGLDLINPLYIGGMPDFAKINDDAGFRSGFVGCISQLVVGVVSTELMRDVKSQNGVVPCDTCSTNPCRNGGVCQEAYSPTGHKCICPAGYSGLSCESTGQTCYPGVCGTGRCINRPDGFECFCAFGTTGSRCEIPINITEPSLSKDSFLAYRTPRAIKRFSIAMEFLSDTMEDGVVVYCSQQEKGDGDFISVALKDKRLEFKFNTGTGTAVLRSEELTPGQMVKFVANRTDQVGSMLVNGEPMQTAEAPGTSRSLNLRTHLYIGGVDHSRIEVSPDVQVKDGLSACIHSIEIMDQRIRLAQAPLDSANVEECGVDPCSRQPCQNGALCEADKSTSAQYRCVCEPGFTGSHCEVSNGVCARSKPCLNNGVCKDTPNDQFLCLCPVGFSGELCADDTYVSDTASFSGNSWIEVDRYLLPQDDIDDQEISLTVSTTSSDGLLLWLGQEPTVNGTNQDYLSLAVVNGYPVLKFEMSGESVTVRGQNRIDDGYPHTLHARKIRNEAGLRVDNDQEVVERGSDSLFSFNTYGNIYIGGTPDLDKMTSGEHVNGFVGCISRMKLGTTLIDDFMNFALSGVNVSPCPSEQIVQETYE